MQTSVHGCAASTDQQSYTSQGITNWAPCSYGAVQTGHTGERNDGVFSQNSQNTLQSISDGTSNTAGSGLVQSCTTPQAWVERDDVKANCGKDLQNPDFLGAAKCGAVCPADQQLAELMAEWPMLPADVRQTILGLLPVPVGVAGEKNAEQFAFL